LTIHLCIEKKDLANEMVPICVSCICVDIFPILFMIEETNKDVRSSLLSWQDPATSLDVEVQRRKVFFVFVEPINSKLLRKAP
jgi:hypothetical protein